MSKAVFQPKPTASESIDPWLQKNSQGEGLGSAPPPPSVSEQTTTVPLPTASVSVPVVVVAAASAKIDITSKESNPIATTVEPLEGEEYGFTKDQRTMVLSLLPDSAQAHIQQQGYLVLISNVCELKLLELQKTIERTRRFLQDLEVSASPLFSIGTITRHSETCMWSVSGTAK